MMHFRGKMCREASKAEINWGDRGTKLSFRLGRLGRLGKSRSISTSDDMWRDQPQGLGRR
jgi:hypothetical protein